jgi:4,5-DOPA dioxygenase extradiol
MSAAQRLPTFFISHGGGPWPWMDFGATNPYEGLSRYLREYPRSLATKPKAILAISGHWEEPQFTVMASPKPPMIYDYSGFPENTYRIHYDAPGSPELARRVRELLDKAGIPSREDPSRGYDHGVFTPFAVSHPDADVPIVQLSIQRGYDPRAHIAMGRALAPLRDEGVLIIGSGNIVHNLHTYAWGKHEVEPFDWAVRFEKLARGLLLAGDHAPLVHYELLGRDALLSAPTPDHYLPLLYVMALRRSGEEVSFPVAGFDGGSISMLTVQIG